MGLRLFYLITSIIVLFFMSFSLVETIRNKTSLSHALSNMLGISGFVIIEYLGILYINNKYIAMTLWCFYFFMFDMSLYALLMLVYAMENRKEESKNARKFRLIYRAFTITDLVLLLINIVYPYEFFIFPYHDQTGKFLGWSFTISIYIHLHYVICYLIAAVIAIRLVKDIIRYPRYYREKYIIIGILFVIAVTVNMLFVVNKIKYVYDFSLLTYGMITIVAFAFSLYSVPRTVQNHMLQASNYNISDAVICFNHENQLVYSNKEAAKFYSEDLPEDQKSWVDKYLHSNVDFAKKTEKIEIQGQSYIISTEFHRLKDKNGRYSGCYIKINDRTDEENSRERDNYKATHDELTGLYNRNSFFSEMEKILRGDPETPRYLVCSNIRNFKIINDLFGSRIGDNLLRLQAEILTSRQSIGSICGRISGDKYALLIPKSEYEEKNIIDCISAVKEFSKEINFQFDVHIGIYDITNPYENVHIMYDKANMAIKNIADDHTKFIAMYDSSLMKKLLEEKNIISEVKNAINEGKICIFLQPQVETKTGKCIGAEALARWYDSEKGYRAPGEFIPVLERTGLIHHLDYYIWEKTAQKLAEWKNKPGFENYCISVNISPKDFYFMDLYKTLTTLVIKYDIPPQKMNLEITESVIFSDNKKHTQILKELQEFGFKIEMDDFGSGYSSLSTLKDVAVDVLKIDMKFLQKTDNVQNSKIIIEAITVMAKKLGMLIITEGVETESQRSFLDYAGADVLQGYLFSKPISVEAFEQKYKEAEK